MRPSRPTSPPPSPSSWWPASPAARPCFRRSFTFRSTASTAGHGLLLLRQRPGRLPRTARRRSTMTPRPVRRVTGDEASVARQRRHRPDLPGPCRPPPCVRPGSPSATAACAHQSPSGDERLPDRSRPVGPSGDEVDRPEVSWPVQRMTRRPVLRLVQVLQLR
jgi:hypothetical protein